MTLTIHVHYRYPGFTNVVDYEKIPTAELALSTRDRRERA